MIKVMLIALTSCICGFTSAQRTCTAVFSGVIVDDNGVKVLGATILLMPQQLGQVSDSLGNFRFTGLCPGRYTVNVQHLSYRHVSFDVTIKGEVNRTIRLTELATALQEVVVLHHDESRTEHAVNFVQVSERELAKSAGKSLGEQLKEIPGVSSIQTGPGIFKPVIHGVHGQRVLILNHGIRQEGQQWGAEHAPEIDPFIASNIVVIKDASAIKYGSDALGGVIIVNPPELPDDAGFGGTVSTVLQSNGRSATLSGMLEGGVGRHPGWGWRVQGTAKRTGDFSAPGYNLTNTGLKELNFSAATGYHKEGIGVDIFFSRFQTEIGILKGTSVSTPEDLEEAMKRPVPAHTTDFSYQIGAPRQEASHSLLKLNGHVKAGSGEWRLQYGFQQNKRREFDLRRGDLTRIPAIDLALYTHTLDIEWETHHTEKRTISFGANGVYQDNNNVYGTRRLPFIPNFNNISTGLFAISRIHWGMWTLNTGVRYDFRSYQVKGFDFKNSFYQAAFDFSNVSASLGVARQVSVNQSLSLNVSSAWRPPHVAELYSLGTHQSAAAIEYGLLLNESTNEVMDIDDVNFKTEKALKTVATYQYSSPYFTFTISPYVNYIFNYIFLRPGGVTETLRGVSPYLRQRQTDAFFLGADLSGVWKAMDYLEILPRVSLLRASDIRNHDYFLFIPSNRYEVAVRYERATFGFRNFYLESGAKYIARQSRAPRVITVEEINEAQEQGIDPLESDNSNFDFMSAPDGYLLWNLSVGCSIKSSKAQYDLRIASENTLNMSYREYTNRLRYYTDDPGRNIILSLKCIF